MFSSSLENAVVPSSSAVLRFLVRDMGNGVQRLLDPRLCPQPVPDAHTFARLSSAALLSGALPDFMEDMVVCALGALKEVARGYVLCLPAHGFARYVEDGLTEFTLRVALGVC